MKDARGPSAGVAALFVALLAGCQPDKPTFTLQAITPASAVEGSAVEIVIQGEGLEPRVFTDFTDSAESRFRAGFSARLGTTSLRQVRLDGQGQLKALVPEGIPPGIYDLKVTDPNQREATLSGAFRIVTFEAVDAQIVGYRVDPIDPQHVFSPFAVRITAVDSQGLDVTPFNGSVVLEDLTGSLVPKASGSFAFGSWTGKVEIRSPHPADVLTVRDSRGRVGTSSPFAVATHTPASLHFVTPERTAVADQCSKVVTVELRDAIDVPATAESDLPLSITTVSFLTLYSDATCSTVLDRPRIDKGGSRFSFYFKGIQLGTFPLDASAAGLSKDSQPVTIEAAPADKLAFGSRPQTVKAGACSAPVVIETHDPFGNPAPVSAALQVALLAPGLALFSDPACATATSSAQLPIGTSSLTFYFRGTQVGAHTIDASTQGLQSAQQTQTLIPADADRLVFTTAPLTQIVGACSAPLDLEARDPFGNLAPAPARRTVSLAVSPSGLAFFRDPACTDSLSAVDLAAGAATARFHFKASAAGTYAVNAAAGTLTPASQNETVELAPADRLVFLTAPQTLVAGNCSQVIQVQARDMNDAPAAVGAPTPVGLNGGATFYADGSCTIPVSSIAIGTSTHTVSFFLRATVAGQLSISAQVPSWIPATQIETIVPGPKDRLAFLTPARTVTANDCSAAVSIGITDALGNATTSSSASQINLSATPSATFAFYSDAACSAPLTISTLPANALGTTVYFKGTQAAQITLDASTSGLTGATQEQTIAPGAPTGLVFLTPSRTAGAGTCSAVLTVQSRDPFGNPSVLSTSAPLALVPSPSTGFTFYSDGSCTLAVVNPTFSAGTESISFYFRGTSAGTVQLSATTLGWSALQSESVLPGPTSQLVFDPISTPQPNQVAFQIRIGARDAYGNPTVGFTGPAALQISPSGTVGCQTNCSASDSTGTFVAASWTGTVLVDAIGAARRLVASSGSVLGLSNAFDVAAPPPVSAPLARITTSSPAVIVGQPVTFKAGSSSDYQTPVGALEVSWDFSGTAVGNPPWVGWSTTKTATQSYSAPGMYEARVAVRDANGDLGYAMTLVKVVASTSSLCVVNTNSVVDDGASSCAGPFGTDGALSIFEAIRLANAGGNLTVTFSGPMAIDGPGRLTLSAPMAILGGEGVSLRLPIDVQAAVLVANLELTAFASASTISSTGALNLVNVFHHHAAGWVNHGSAVLSHVRMSRCLTDCFTDEAGLSLSISDSQIESSPAHGVVLSTCALGASMVEIQSSTFQGLKTAVKSVCDRPISIVHSTFDRNERAVEYAAGTGHVLRNNLFVRHNAQAVSCGTASFLARDHALVFQNANDGCVAGALNADPLFAYPAASDLRFSPGSPAVDAAVDLGKDVNGPAPGSFFGTAPDLGAGEST